MDAASLRTEFIARYAHIAIPRADRFLSTCQRIAAPYQANSFSSTEALNKYMQTTWTPRVRNAPKGIINRYVHHIQSSVSLFMQYTK